MLGTAEKMIEGTDVKTWLTIGDPMYLKGS